MACIGVQWRADFSLGVKLHDIDGRIETLSQTSRIAKRKTAIVIKPFGHLNIHLCLLAVTSADSMWHPSRNTLTSTHLCERRWRDSRADK